MGNLLDGGRREAAPRRAMGRTCSGGDRRQGSPTFGGRVMAFLRLCEPTGRRKAPPDDRPREAIHQAAKRQNGLLRRFAPRNDDQYETTPLAAFRVRL